ncbi:methyltransferase domain-containing protein [Enterococcus hermanniensis]|uniref:Methyltransferase domain-containing protein n=1 Tax=Enterococcus hermanniensis TaxID=249189 RepID=A0A1L8TS78_9ENTE|nr:class I SAM-dependent methyltransferase [Enterococcus hermanniensis]OJG47038.1 hypothetical protein RV04_GL000285 [Enterococcus hermanniensis]
MTNERNELSAFWDNFAEEYEEIQQESSFLIAADLADFLIQQKILPCADFLDLAGGTGRYLEVLQSHTQQYTLLDISVEMLKIATTKAAKNTQLLHQEQTSFLSTNTKRYDVVFSAMNPAILTKDELLACCQASRQWVLLLRLIEDEDQLFSPFEEKNPDLFLNQRYKNYLLKEQIGFQTKRFEYKKTEAITKSFFHDYFALDFSSEKLEALTEEIFGSDHERANQQSLTFELIYFQVPNVYNENGSQ